MFFLSLWSWPKTGAYASQHCCINIHGTPLIKRKRKIGSYGVHMNVLMQHAVLFLFSLLDGTLCPDLLFFFFSCRAACHEVKKKKGRETWWSYGPTRSDAKRWDRTIKEQPKGNAWAPTIPWGATISSLSVLSLQHGFYSTRALLPPFLG